MSNPRGNQSFTDIEYRKFLTDMEPFLKMGETLHHAIIDAELIQHRSAIYDKYALKDYFAETVDIWRSYPGKLANNILVSNLIEINQRKKQGIQPTKDEMDDVKFIADKHRSAQEYFVNRTETAKGKPVEEVLHELDNDIDAQHDNVADEAAKQVVEAEPPVQNQDQAGPDSNVQAQPDPVQTPEPNEGA